ncbi:hypothetical protein Pelo_7561 [Pelomyxa schiedti]|nr:hypothetical protein Pelo_7561 [Pelomyxa schiedti]
MYGGRPRVSWWEWAKGMVWGGLDFFTLFFQTLIGPLSSGTIDNVRKVGGGTGGTGPNSRGPGPGKKPMGRINSASAMDCSMAGGG